MSTRPGFSYLKILSLWITAVLALFIIFSGACIKYYSRSRHGIKTTGTVISTHCDLHNSFEYKFITASGNTQYAHDAATGTGSTRIHCRKLRPGSRITVTYLPYSPTKSSAAISIREAMYNDLFFAIVASCSIPTFAILILLSSADVLRDRYTFNIDFLRKRKDR